jgi:UDP-4-amino-4,6-dideoxy-N-acetyl-beta-L-altrosamine N-acetyltransferase
MTVLENKGVKLIRLTDDKIEMVRQWRNDPKISQYMEFRDYITPEMQREWFKRINNAENYYFLIYVNEQAVGMVNIKNIANNSGETGIFIYSDSCKHTDVSKLSYSMLLDYAFDILKLKSIEAHILQENMRSKIFHLNFGYKLISDQNNVENQKYCLCRADYMDSIYRKRFEKD